MCGNKLGSASCQNQQFIGMSAGGCLDSTHIYQCSKFNEIVVDDKNTENITAKTFNGIVELTSPRTCYDCPESTIVSKRG